MDRHMRHDEITLAEIAVKAIGTVSGIEHSTFAGDGSLTEAGKVHKSASNYLTKLFEEATHPLQAPAATE